MIATTDDLMRPHRHAGDVPSLCLRRLPGGAMLSIGAARFGRRTPGPHDWPAAPHPIMRGGGRRGAEMDDETSLPEWIASLRPEDQDAAQRALETVGGEATLRRICDAFSAGTHGRGRPPNIRPLDRLFQAWSRYLRTEKQFQKDIVEEIVRADQRVVPSDLVSACRDLRRELSKEIRFFRRKYIGIKSRHPVDDGAEFKNFKEIFERLCLDEEIVRLGDESKAQTDLVSMRNRLELTQRNLIRRYKITEERFTIKIQRWKNLAMKKYNKDLIQITESIQHRLTEAGRHAHQVHTLASFMKAFSYIIPVELGISTIAELHQEVETYLRERMKDQSERTKNQ